MENLTYDQAIEKSNIKKYIIKNYPVATSNPKMRRSLENFTYNQLLQLKNLLENK
tara:strand:- start:872 stop:1036 length:165 start_codon:yes stop_codon:yes gene_type:complete